MSGRREKTRIALLIVIAVLAVAFAMLEALESSSDTAAAHGKPVQTSEL